MYIIVRLPHKVYLINLNYNNASHKNKYEMKNDQYEHLNKAKTTSRYL